MNPQAMTGLICGVDDKMADLSVQILFCSIYHIKYKPYPYLANFEQCAVFDNDDSTATSYEKKNLDNLTNLVGKE